MLSQVKQTNSKFTFGHIQSEKHITRTICYYLSDTDLNQCALVSKVWHAIVHDARSVRTVRVNYELCESIKKRRLKLNEYISREWPYARDVIINGWSGVHCLPVEFYDQIFESNLRPKSVILRGRGLWEDCKCPSQKDPNANETLTNMSTNLESLHIAGTFCISSCALLNIVSRSPNLKTLKFYGLICKHDHCEPYKQLPILSDLETIHWPWPSKRQMPTLLTLTHRHDNLVTFYSSSEAVCDSLAADKLRNVKYMSICLNENWQCKPKGHKKANKFVQKIQYLSLAKNVEALEVRTFDAIVASEEEEEKVPFLRETNEQVMKIFENYKLTFWAQVAKLENLKYLAIYGSWDFDAACREMAKHALKVEYLKINLMPNSVLTAIDANEDCPILSMVDGVRNLRKLPYMKSLHYICHEKLLSIDDRTTTAMKELIDLFWVIDIKTGLSDEVIDLMNNIMRRGTQLGKVYKYLLHVQSKLDSEYANSITEQTLRYPLGTNLKEKMTTIVEGVASNRYGREGYEAFQLWGLHQVGNTRDRLSYEKLSSDWNFYNEKFKISMAII